MDKGHERTTTRAQALLRRLNLLLVCSSNRVRNVFVNWNIGVTSVGCGMTATVGQVERQVNAQRLLFESSDP
jgi:hypothetical protein